MDSVVFVCPVCGHKGSAVHSRWRGLYCMNCGGIIRQEPPPEPEPEEEEEEPFNWNDFDEEDEEWDDFDIDEEDEE